MHRTNNKPIVSQSTLFQIHSGPKPTEICFSVLSEDDVGEATKCINESFVNYNPLTKKMRITEQEYKTYSHHICKLAVEAGLSIIARDKNNNNEFIGCIIVHPTITTKTEPTLSKKFEPIFALAKEASKNILKKINHYELVRLLTITVHGKYQDQGIATKLFALQLYYLSQTTFKNFSIEFTNNYGYQAMLHTIDTNIKHSNTIHYSDFFFEGNKPFEDLHGKIISCVHPIRSLIPEKKIWAENQFIANTIAKHRMSKL